MANQVQGSCLCEAITFTLTPPFPASAHCHCGYCRKAHGAAFVTWVVADTKGFQLISGKDSLRWYQSSEQSRRGFCAACGSTLFFESTLCPGETHVARANLTGRIEPAPKYHCFVEQIVPWVTIHDDLIRLKGDGPELGKYRAVKESP